MNPGIYVYNIIPACKMQIVVVSEFLCKSILTTFQEKQKTVIKIVQDYLVTPGISSGW